MSSSEQDRVRELAERVARRLSDSAEGESAADGGGGLDALRESLSEIQRRLARIESQMTNGRAQETPAQQRRPAAVEHEGAPAQQSSPHTTPTRSTWLSGTYVPAVSHPSQEQFTGIGEAVSELVEFFEREKTCTVEPGGKPCDHCGVCSSRGF
jgi:hypothetical protein